MSAASTDRQPLVVTLDDPAALDPSLVGAKAANLARLAATGLPVLPGFVITTAATGRGARVLDADELHRQWADLTDASDRVLVVRSSSTVEDATTSSMAGRFTSVLDVHGWDEFCVAVTRVIESASAVGTPAPIAVLVQRQLEVTVGGVLFGADPVHGRTDRLVVEWVRDRPDSLVSGRVLAAHAELSPHGRLIRQVIPSVPSPTSPTEALPRRVRRRLARMARTTGATFGAPRQCLGRRRG